MSYMLDTQAFLWWDSQSRRLSPAALAVLQNRANEFWVSVLTVWEITIKSQTRKLQTRAPIEDIIRHHKMFNFFHIIEFKYSHALAVGQLPMIHKDPFDRALMAQAISEGFTLISADRIFQQYPVSLLW